MAHTSLRDIASAHHRSFAEGGRTRRGALLSLYSPAAIAVGTLILIRWLAPSLVNLDDDVGQGLVAALTLLAGLLFALGVTVLEKAIDMDVAGPDPSRATTTAALRLQALSANALFTSILSGGATAALLAGMLVPTLACPMNILATGIVVAVATSGMAVARRVFSETVGRTERARTGVSRDARRPPEE